MTLAQHAAVIAGLGPAIRRILQETLMRHIAQRLSLDVPPLPQGWFLSDLWFESAAEYTPEHYGFEISERVLEWIRENPAFALFHFLGRVDGFDQDEAGGEGDEG